MTVNNDISEEIYNRQRILISAYLTPAKRPLNSRMDCGATQRAFGIARPNWRDGLNMILQELEGTK